MSSCNKQVIERLTHLENDFKQVEELKEEVQEMKKLLWEIKATIDASEEKSTSIKRAPSKWSVSEEHQMSFLSAEINLDGTFYFQYNISLNASKL